MDKEVKVALLVTLFAFNVILFTPEPAYVPEELTHYVNEVYRLSGENLDGRNLNYRFIRNQGAVLGSCNLALGAVEIGRDSWDYMTERERIILIAHEVTHCVKYMDHIILDFSNGCRGHYMDEYMTSKHCIYRDFYKYVKQMREI